MLQELTKAQEDLAKAQEDQKKERQAREQVEARLAEELRKAQEELAKAREDQKNQAAEAAENEAREREELKELARTPPRGMRDMTCVNCGLKTHTAKDCRKPKKVGLERPCFECGVAGHIARDCPRTTDGTGNAWFAQGGDCTTTPAVGATATRGEAAAQRQRCAAAGYG